MKTKKAILLTVALLFAMIGAAWSQRTNRSDTRPVANRFNGNANYRPPGDWVDGNTNRPLAPASWNSNTNRWDIDYANLASSNATGNRVYDDGSNTASVANSVHNAAANANTVPRKKKTRRPAKRRVSSIPTVGNTLANILAAALVSRR